MGGLFLIVLMILSLVFYVECDQLEPDNFLGHFLLQKYFIVCLPEILELFILFCISIYHYALHFQVFYGFDKFISSDFNHFIFEVLIG